MRLTIFRSQDQSLRVRLCQLYMVSRGSICTVSELMRQENEQLKQLVAELALKNKVLTPALAGGAREKSLLGMDTTLDL